MLQDCIARWDVSGDADTFSFSVVTFGTRIRVLIWHSDAVAHLKICVPLSVSDVLSHGLRTGSNMYCSHGLRVRSLASMRAQLASWSL